jgi:DNA repair protein RadD
MEKDGELVEFGATGAGKTSKIDEPLWHGALARIGRKKGYAPGWASHQFKARFGRWPMQRYPLEQEPTVEILNWVRSRQIAYAKAGQSSG